ncbi:D-threo-aldose 1-dehydrogenase [Planctomycetes bacterium Poly30]|uniref:D-threo-aldose 1-dehydrogenase n=1 Tax=Saltatorellus ferox TaxID=2528018 RepID=A0A518EY13_9BACT|nr:D-threo-aldose 1-dehydrogenase [Planctomycetes bacterium Poly30]
MEYRTLGKTGLSISTLAFGGAPLGDIFGELDESAALDAVHAALDGGINYFDTAPLYGFGLAEERIGRALKGRRDDVVLATKCCRDGFEEFDFSGARVISSVEESLKRLGTDRIDVLQIHDVEFGTRRQVLEEALPAARKLKETGKVRFVGITGLPVRYLRSLAEVAEIDTLLSWGHCNLLEDELEEELVPLAAERGFGLINASPVLQGILTEREPPAWHRSPKPVLEMAPRVAALCRGAGFDVAAVAVAYAVRRPAIATTIVGMRSRAEVEANVAAMTLDIPEELFERIEQLVAPVKNMMWFEGRPENNLPPTDPDRYVPRTPSTTHS